MQNWREWLPRVLFESMLIVFSVLLALALDEWRQDRRQEARAVLARESIRAELHANRAATRRAFEYHSAMHDTLQALADRDQLPPQRIYYGGMFTPAGVVGTAWESARETGAVDQIPYGLVLSLSRVYESQGKYDVLGKQLVADVYDDIRHRGAEAVLRDGYRGFLVLTEDFANREAHLLERYDSVLASLEGLDRPSASLPAELQETVRAPAEPPR